MKKLLSITYLLLLPLFVFSQTEQKNFDYFFNLLADCPTLEKMVELCHDYNFQEEQPKKGFKTFKAPDGTKFCFRMDNINEKLKVPIIKMTTKTSKKELEKILINLGYKEEGDKFIKGTKHTPTLRACLIKENKKTKECKLTIIIRYN